MSNYRTIGEVEEQYLRDHPDEVDDYMTVLFDEYAESGDTAALLSSLRVVSRVKGVSRIAEISGLSRKGLQKALSENGNPQFGSVNAIMHAWATASRRKSCQRQRTQLKRPASPDSRPWREKHRDTVGESGHARQTYRRGHLE
jgi:probable addiction module antidote protein